MLNKTPTLGRQLLSTLTDLDNLIGKTSDGQNLEKLIAQRQALIEKISNLVEINISRISDEYKNATATLIKASVKIKQSAEGLESVSKAINELAVALGTLSKVLVA